MTAKNDTAILVSEIVFESDGVEIQVVSLEDNPDRFGIYVAVDSSEHGALMVMFDPGAGLEAVLAFIMALQNAEPVRASARVQSVLAGLASEGVEVEST